MPLIQLELIADPDALAEAAIRFLEDSIPGFEARPGNVETVLLYATAQIGAAIVEQASEIDPLIFSYLGEDLLGIPAAEATEATGELTITWGTDVDTATVYPAGSLVAVPAPSGESIAFQTNTDSYPPPGGGGPGSVAITALEAGELGNGAYGPAEPVDIVAGADALVVETPTAGGTEEETTDEYQTRLAEALTILAPRPILPADFSTMARQIAGVGRAHTIDLYQPSTGQGGYGTPRGASPQTNVPRCATVVVTADDGTAPGDPLLQEVYARLDGSREVNFLVYVVPPGYDVIDVQATVRAYPGYSPAEVAAAAEVELAYWLDPGVWGTPPGAFGGEWFFDNTVRLYEAVDVLNGAGGVHYVESVQIRKSGGTFGTADIALKSPVGLPSPGAFTITVTTP